MGSRTDTIGYQDSAFWRGVFSGTTGDPCNKRHTQHSETRAKSHWKYVEEQVSPPGPSYRGRMATASMRRVAVAGEPRLREPRPLVEQRRGQVRLPPPSARQQLMKPISPMLRVIQV